MTSTMTGVECPICELKVTKADLTSHVKTAHRRKRGPFRGKKPASPGLKCPLRKCGFASSSDINLKRHIRDFHKANKDSEEKAKIQPAKIKMKPLTHACDFCDFESTQTRRMKDHYATAHRKYAVFCDRCAFRGQNEAELREHARGKHQSEVLKVEKSYPRTRETLQKYGITLKAETESGKTQRLPVNGKKVFKCESCDYRTYRVSMLKRHMMMKHKRNCFGCNVCNFIFNAEEQLRRHVMRVHSNTNKNKVNPDVEDVNPMDLVSVEMNVETLDLNSNESEAEAETEAAKKKVYNCHVCEYKSYFSANTKRHVYTAHGQVDSQKHRIRAQKSPLNQTPTDDSVIIEQDDEVIIEEGPETEAESTNGDKKFRCEECNLSLSSSQSLCRHLAAIHGAKPDKIRVVCRSSSCFWFWCSECDYYATESKTLVQHYKLRHNEVKFICSRCPFAANSKKVLGDHFADRHDVDKGGEEQGRFRCHTCDYKAALKHKVERHIFGAHGEEVVLCERCDFRSRNQDKIDEHVLKYHC